MMDKLTPKEVSKLKVGDEVFWFEDKGSPESGPEEPSLCSGTVTKIREDVVLVYIGYMTDVVKKSHLVHAPPEHDEGQPEPEPEDKEPSFYSVAICMTDRAYGGPEEGGWWYDTYEPAKEFTCKTIICKTKDEAFDAQDKLREFIKTEKLNEGRRPVSSVLSEGEYTVHIFEDEYPTNLPKVKPHYE